MNGKDRRHPGAGPKIAGHSQQNQKQKHRGRRVQQHVGQKVSGRIQAVELAVQHVGDTRQRAPLAQRAIGQRPPKSGKRQSGSNVRILGNVGVVVEGDELVAHRLAKDEAHGQQEKTADGPNPIDPRSRVGWP